MSISRVAGQMLQTILERDGIDISFANANVGINNASPTERLDVTGNVKADWFLGNVDAPGNVVSSGIVTGNITANSALFNNDVIVIGTLTTTSNVIANTAGIFYGNTVTGVGAIYAGVPGFTPLPNTVVQIAGNAEPYVQVNFENTNGNGTTDYVATADTGTDTTHYVDVGIAGSTYDNPAPVNSLGTIISPLDAYFYAQGDGVGGAGGNLAIGTTEPGREIRIFTGGVNADSIIATISNNGLDVVGNITTGNITISVDTISGLANIVLAPVGNVDVSNVNIGNLAEPGANSDAATKFYVDSVTGNISGIGNLTVTDTTIGTVAANANIYIDTDATGTFYILGSAGFVIPTGNTAQRPATGNAAGTVRFNTDSAEIEVYDGTEWDSIVSDVTNQVIVPDGSSLVYTLDKSSTAAGILVSINGLIQIPGVSYSYTVSGNQITFSDAPLISDIIDIRFL